MENKRKLLLIAIDKFSLLKGEQKSALEQGLKKVMQYRNAFAHGTLAHNGQAQELHFFEGGPQKSTLDDAYFEKVENVFLAAWELLGQIQEKIKQEPRG